MSKSDNVELGRVNISDSPDLIRKKIRKAISDSVSKVEYDPENRPGISNLVLIYSAITGDSPDSICDQFKNVESVEMKDALAEVIIEHLKPIQQKLAHLESDSGYINEVLARGAERAKEKAAIKQLDMQRSCMAMCNW